MRIKKIQAREILDSRGNQTIETELSADFGKFSASVPSGASVGKYEAKELKSHKAIKNIEKIIALRLKGKNVSTQKEIDDLMIKLDGTKNKSRLGANAILSVSIAFCRASAAAKNIPLYQRIAQLGENKSPLTLPQPCFNIINGGAHAGNNLDFQEFMIVPQIKPFSKALRAGCEIYQELAKILQKKYGKSAINVGLEGGFAPPIKYPEDALNLIQKAIKQTGYNGEADISREAGYKNKVKIILDVAASQFFQNKKYKTNFGVFSSNGLLRYYLSLIKKYPIIAIEDPFAENDWQGFKELTENSSPLDNGELFSVIGDDLTVTNIKRIKKAVQEKAIQGIIIKPNQIGTISETIEAIKYAKKNNLKIFVKHRSGETNDDFIADLAVGIGADGIMAGAPARGERVAKYNRLLKIEQELKEEKNG